MRKIKSILTATAVAVACMELLGCGRDKSDNAKYATPPASQETQGHPATVWATNGTIVTMEGWDKGNNCMARWTWNRDTNANFKWQWERLWQ
jgi:hypothetical protein